VSDAAIPAGIGLSASLGRLHVARQHAAAPSAHRYRKTLVINHFRSNTQKLITDGFPGNQLYMNSICLVYMSTPFKIQIQTKVAGDFRSVMNQFDRDLFEALSPPVGKIELVKFTGSKTGDTVHLRFVHPIRAEWISLITDHGERDGELYFVDEGKKLPPGLTYWKHEHVVRKLSSDQSLIIDRIRFKSYFWILSLLLYPIVFLTFYPRKKQYKSYFGE